MYITLFAIYFYMFIFISEKVIFKMIMFVNIHVIKKVAVNKIWNYMVSNSPNFIFDFEFFLSFFLSTYIKYWIIHSKVEYKYFFSFSQLILLNSERKTQIMLEPNCWVWTWTWLANLSAVWFFSLLIWSNKHWGRSDIQYLISISKEPSITLSFCLVFYYLYQFFVITFKSHMPPSLYLELRLLTESEKSNRNQTEK